MTKEQMIKWIDNASLYALLEKWRFAKAGDPFFMDEVGQHYSKVMFAKRDKNPDEWVAASKSIGWERR